MSEPLSAAIPTLVGREREQAALRAALDAALKGRGSLVLIGGEAGIGKTALAEALLGEAAALGALALVGRCYDLSETPPYGPWAELFARAPGDPDLPPLPAAVLPPEREGAALTGQDAIVGRVRDYLAALAARRPLALLLEDLHWADPASLDLLRVVGRGLAEVPLLLLATYRADELPPGHPLAARLPALAREARAARLDLRPLDGHAIAALVAGRYALGASDRARLAAYLLRRSEGNPLFLGELLRTLESTGLLEHGAPKAALGDLDGLPVPTLLRQVIAGRLARLGDEDRRLLAVAAVIGQELSFDIWATVGEVAEEALLATTERAVAVRVLEATEQGGRFVHALIREALYDGVLAPRRRDWHRRAAEALLATPHPDPDAAAHHLQRAGDPRAAGWLAVAGARAVRAAAWLTAVERFVAAAAVLADNGARGRERGWLLYLGANLLFATNTARAQHLLDESGALARLAGDPALAAHGLILRGLALCHDRRLRDGVAAMERGTADLIDLADDDRGQNRIQLALARLGSLLPGETPTPVPSASAPPSVIQSRRALANWYGWLGNYRRARAAGEANRAAEVDRGLGQEISNWGLALARAALGQPVGARREFALVHADTHLRSDLYSLVYILFAEMQHLIMPYHADDQAERARLVALEASAVAQMLRTNVAAPYPAQADLPVALVEGRWDEARRLAEAGVAHATVGQAQNAAAALGLLARWQGDPEAAWARVRALHPHGPESTPGDCIFIPGLALLALAADLALDAGDPALAERWIAAHGRWLDWSGAILWQTEHLLLRARRARLGGDATAARRHAEAALARATEPRQPLALLAAHRLLGELDTDDGRHADAAAHLSAALALADACAAPYERALTLLALAELRAAEGGAGAADGHLCGARAILEPLGARPALDRAEVLAARFAAPAPPPAPPGGLSPREAEVLALLAAGRSTHAIAQALYLSPRTVQRHVANAYLKIGAHNKAEATAFALRHGLAR